MGILISISALVCGPWFYRGPHAHTVVLHLTSSHLDEPAPWTDAATGANREDGDDSQTTQKASLAGAGADSVDAGGGGDATRAGGQLASACSGSASIVARLHFGVHLETYSADWPLA